MKERFKILLIVVCIIYPQFCKGNALRKSDANNQNKDRKLQPISDEEHTKTNLKILTLGGSVTWGAALASREQAYPYLLSHEGNYIVHNLAVRASDPHYPSLCLQSILRGRESIEFDVIILEFSLNGYNGLTTLIKRLQYRYPNAALIYMHLYSLNISTRKHLDGSIVWSDEPFFHPGPAIQHLLDEINAYTYIFPQSDDPKDVEFYFAQDRHHLSEHGHQRIANDFIKLLSETSFERKHDDNLDNFKWGDGDQCEHWLHTGKIEGFVVENYSQGTLKSMKDDDGNDNYKFTIEFEKSGSITIENRSSNTVPVYILYMSAQNRYPITNIAIGDKVTSVDPHRVHNHVAEATPVGWANPGANVLHIEPTNETLEPFRILGIALFGFSYNIDLPFLRFHNIVGNLIDTIIL